MIVEEHSSILAVPMNGTCDEFRKPENKNKNLCLDFPCWDISRVILFHSSDGSDYINANYISGFDMKNKFIATQEPMATTVDSFYSMIWQENSRVIVMFVDDAKSQSNSFQYFPSNQNTTILKQFMVKIKKVKVERYYTETILSIVYMETGEVKIVYCFKFLDWPETGVPEVKEFLDFLLAVNRKYQNLVLEAVGNMYKLLPGPIVVNGKAGIGRTTTFCAIDICLYRLIHTTFISVPSAVLEIRQQRNFGISALNQYIFINNVLLYFLVTIRSNFASFLEFRSHFTTKDIHLLS